MKKIKGFTLVELIIVMAILAILMSAIMQMFKPIRETYIDSTLYETQRTSQGGVIQYITESVRFATDMGIYNDGITSASAAVTAFADAYCAANNITDAAIKTNITNELKENADMIVIDNTDTTYGGKTCYGRLIRRKIDGTQVLFTDYRTETAKARMALGAPYYDDNTYSISLDVSDKVNGMLGVTVASTTNHGGRVLDKNQLNADGSFNTASSKVISSTGEVLCRNLTGATSGGTNLGVSTVGMYDTDKFVGGSTTKGKNTYIVFINAEVRKELEALNA